MLDILLKIIRIISIVSRPLIILIMHKYLISKINTKKSLKCSEIKTLNFKLSEVTVSSSNSDKELLDAYTWQKKVTTNTH